MDRRSDDRDGVLDDIIAWARGEDAVRAVLLCGSRAVEPGRVDELSDYDVVLSLADPEALAADARWVERFGDVLVELPQSYGLAGREIVTRLVQYRDGTKIDFSLVSAAELERIVRQGDVPRWLDAGYEVLVDKDGTASELPAASGEAHVPVRPAPEAFRTLAEEFWWETLYVAKHLVRGHALPARYCLECVLRYELLVPALAWYVQLERGWSQPVGRHGRGLEDLLPGDVWRSVETTMPGPDPAEVWDALFAAAGLFRRVMKAVADDLDLCYRDDLDRDVTARLRELRRSAGEGR